MKKGCITSLAHFDSCKLLSIKVKKMKQNKDKRKSQSPRKGWLSLTFPGPVRRTGLSVI